MKRTLTDYLMSVKKDLSQMKAVREYLKSNVQSEESCFVSWKTIEALNTIIAEYNFQDCSDFDVLDILLECLNYITGKDDIWSRFGVDLGVISGKILTSMEKTHSFDDLFCKFLDFVQVSSTRSSDIWKSVARQILNVFINKNFSFGCMKKLVNIYVCTLRQLDRTVLEYFAKQNLNLLKTLSMLLPSLGDYETQLDFMEVVLLHFSDATLVEDFFTEEKGHVKNLFKSLRFEDFEGDCRVFLNVLNKKSFGRKVYSICCSMLYLGGCFMEPPLERQSIWIDANKDSESISFKYSELGNPERQQVSYVEFSNLVGIGLETSNGKHCLTIKTSNMEKLHQEAKSNDILCIADMSDNPQNEIQDFVDFLDEVIRKERKRRKMLEERLSKTCDEILVIKTNNEYEIKLIKETGKEIEKKAAPRFEIVLAKETGRQSERTNIGCDIDLFKDTENKDRNTTSRYEIELFKNVDSQTGSSAGDELFARGKKETKTFLQNNEISSSVNFISDIQENALKLFEKNQLFEDSQESLKNSENFSKNTFSVYSPEVVSETQQHTPSSFVESLNRNIGIGSSECKRSFEDSIPTVEFQQKSQGSDKKNHKLFKNSEDMFSFLPDEPQNGEKVVEGDKENTQPEIKTPRVKERKKREKKVPGTTTVVLRDRRTLKSKFFDSQSDCFRKPGSKKMKPTLPKLKRRKCTSTRKKHYGENTTKLKKSCRNEDTNNSPIHGGKSSSITRPSLLDPNGYTYQRWIKPTTSKRSNFWLEKINALEKPKPENDSVFDFSDFDNDNTKNKTRRNSSANKSRKRRGKTETKQITLKDVRETLKSNLKVSCTELESANLSRRKENTIKPTGKEILDLKKKSSEAFIQNLSSCKYGLDVTLKKGAEPAVKAKETSQEKNNKPETENVWQKSAEPSKQVFNRTEATTNTGKVENIVRRVHKGDKTQEKLTKPYITRRSIPEQNTTPKPVPEQNLSLKKFSETHVTSKKPTGRTKTSQELDDSSGKSSVANMSHSDSSEQAKSPEKSPTQASEQNITPIPSEMDIISEKLSDDSLGESTEHDLISKQSSELYQTDQVSEQEKFSVDTSADSSAHTTNFKKVTDICRYDFGNDSDRETSSEDEAGQTKSEFSEKTNSGSPEPDLFPEKDINIFEIPKKMKTKKRERSDEDSSSSKIRLKKKHKRYRFTHRKSIPLMLQHRMQKKEARIKQQTGEIIETVNKATNHLFEHIQRKAGGRLGSYLREAEKAAVKIQELDDSKSRAKKLEKVLAYYETGCSVRELGDVMNVQVMKIKTALNDLTNSKIDNTLKIKRINERLKDLIESEIDKSIEKELESKRENLMKCLTTQIGESVL